MGMTYFGMFLISSVNDWSAAYFSVLFAVSIEAPAADFVAAHNVLHKKDAIAKFQW